MTELALLAGAGVALVTAGVFGFVLICAVATDREEDWEDRTW